MFAKATLPLALVLAVSITAVCVAQSTLPDTDPLAGLKPDIRVCW